jgi:hypothetical protein
MLAIGSSDSIVDTNLVGLFVFTSGLDHPLHAIPVIEQGGGGLQQEVHAAVRKEG